MEQIASTITARLTVAFRLAVLLAAFAAGPVANAAEAQVVDPVDPGLQENKPAESKVPDAENGLKIARTLCVSCHLIGEPKEGPSPADVPTFKSIANRPNQSMEGLTNWLVAPHAPMPDPHLTRVEIRDLAGYILSLREQK